MKKTILLILAILPIVLLVVIAFAGRILSIYQHIPVERVEFVDRFNNPYKEEHVFSVDQGSSKATSIIIYPELASNKKVSYSSADESVCTVDDEGVITGVRYGTTTVLVSTEDGAKVAVLNVRVKADIPIDVTLSKNELSMFVGEIFQLEATVETPVAQNKDVFYESSDPEVVRVDATGKLLALGEGSAVITVTTASGGLSDTCTVTVKKGELPVSFDFEGATDIVFVNGVYEVYADPLDLRLYLKVSGSVNKEEVIIKLQSANSQTTLEDGILTFNVANRLVTVRAYVGDDNNPDNMTEIKLVYKN